MRHMGPLPDRLLKRLGGLDPLSDPEIDELAIALKELAVNGIGVPRHLLRHEYISTSNELRHYGSTLGSVPYVTGACDEQELRDTLVAIENA
jgi:hypothetical protein